MRSGGSSASTTFKMAAPVASGSPGTLPALNWAMAVRAPS
jgi:hypothetical protein